MRRADDSGLRCLLLDAGGRASVFHMPEQMKDSATQGARKGLVWRVSMRIRKEWVCKKGDRERTMAKPGICKNETPGGSYGRMQGDMRVLILGRETKVDR